ncbi:MAG: universal stress protein [Paramuribaculum sp.]|nr:universal stress protein [Paramuribaculum sp.]
MEDRLITVAIHTYDRAVELKSYLENEGIEVVLQNINLTTPIISSGVRVRIHESDLPKALRLIENVEIFTIHSSPSPSSPNSKIILVPVDFSEISLKACKVAFSIANSRKTEVMLLHSFVDPSMTASIQLSDNLDFDIEESEMLETIAKDAEKRMIELSEDLRDKIKNGELPPVKFSRKIIEGLPEEAINEFSKEISPYLIVMGTRGKDKKERELIGSVTAEVLDTCRSPILTIAENSSLESLKHIKSIVMFCTLDQRDLIALDCLSKLYLDNCERVTLVVISPKKPNQLNDNATQALFDYCRQHYPALHFELKIFSMKNLVSEFNSLIENQEVNLIVVPNKKKNAFARLFNPGIAHRLLFSTDTPMIVLPV